MYIYSLHDILAIWPIGLDEVSFQRGIRAKLGFHLTTAAEHSHRTKLDARLLCSPLLSARAEAVAGSMLPPPDPGCPVVGIRPEANPLFSSPFSRRNRTIHSSRCRAMLPGVLPPSCRPPKPPLRRRRHAPAPSPAVPATPAPDPDARATPTSIRCSHPFGSLLCRPIASADGSFAIPPQISWPPVLHLSVPLVAYRQVVRPAAALVLG